MIIERNELHQPIVAVIRGALAAGAPYVEVRAGTYRRIVKSGDADGAMDAAMAAQALVIAGCRAVVMVPAAGAPSIFHQKVVMAARPVDRHSAEIEYPSDCWET